MAMVMTTTSISLRISRLVVNQLTCLWDGASMQELSFIFRYICVKTLSYIVTYETLVMILPIICRLMCDWSLGTHKVLHSILSLKLGVTFSNVVVHTCWRIRFDVMFACCSFMCWVSKVFKMRLVDRSSLLTGTSLSLSLSTKFLVSQLKFLLGAS
jgi:hypothetical protein